jgi:hypothetical protein
MPARAYNIGFKRWTIFVAAAYWFAVTNELPVCPTNLGNRLRLDPNHLSIFNSE